MSNKIRFYHTWNTREILISAGAILLIASVILGITFRWEIGLFLRSSQMDGQAYGELLKVDEQIGLYQTRLGNKLDIDHFVVEYQYKVGEEIFTASDKVEGSIVNAIYLNEKWQSDKRIKVIYSSDDPSNSMLQLDVN